MSDYSTYPRQDAYKTQLTQGISDSDSVCPVLVAPSVTVTAPDKIYIGIDYDNSSYELCKGTIAAGVITLTDRAQATYEGGTGVARSHSSGAKVIISHTWKTFADIATAIATKLDKSGGTMSGALEFSGTDHAGIKLISLTTAQINALGAVANGYKVYDTTTGEVKTRIGGAWVVEAAGGVFPNADTATAGKVEIPTQAESDSGAGIGGTGAALASTPETTAGSVQKGTWLYAADAGASDTYAVTLTPAPAAYATGMMLFVKVNTGNTGAATLNVNTLGAKTIKKFGTLDLETGDLLAGVIYQFVYDGTNFQLLSQIGEPTGSIKAWPAASAPSGYLLADGSAVSRSTYAALFALISTTYGVGDGATTFNVPNLKGKVIVGYNSAETEFDALGETGGEKTHTLTVPEIPSHSHSIGTVNLSGGWVAAQSSNTAADHSYQSGSTGGGGAHNNLQPYITLNYIIKT